MRKQDNLIKLVSNQAPTLPYQTSSAAASKTDYYDWDQLKSLVETLVFDGLIYRAGPDDVGYKAPKAR